MHCLESGRTSWLTCLTSLGNAAVPLIHTPGKQTKLLQLSHKADAS